ncbi:Hypothetical predicted protein [Pelobates cultripes]|uniref:Uncharacterized protein n=1 Tax=Pelobates cultripes TaxID=61616 RepID=A0AAD1RBR9_PELCU|nr:Hypothetical predicted protein [Pelobates cultripes]
MSDHPEPAVSAELKAWLQAAIADTIPMALAAFRDQPLAAPTATITQLSDSDDSRVSDHDEAPHKRPWKGDSDSAGKGKVPAKTAKLSHAKRTFNKGLTFGYHGWTNRSAYSDEDLPHNKTS